MAVVAKPYADTTGGGTFGVFEELKRGHVVFPSHLGFFSHVSAAPMVIERALLFSYMATPDISGLTC